MGWLKAARATQTVTPVVSNETATELLRILGDAKFKLSVNEPRDLPPLYLPYAQAVVLPDSLPILPVPCRDTADDVFLHLALAKQVEFLVRGDADLLMKRPFAPVSILTLAEVKVKIGP